MGGKKFRSLSAWSTDWQRQKISAINIWIGFFSEHKKPEGRLEWQHIEQFLLYTETKTNQNENISLLVWFMCVYMCHKFNIHTCKSVSHLKHMINAYASFLATRTEKLKKKPFELSAWNVMYMVFVDGMRAAPPQKHLLFDEASKKQQTNLRVPAISWWHFMHNLCRDVQQVFPVIMSSTFCFVLSLCLCSCLCQLPVGCSWM